MSPCALRFAFQSGGNDLSETHLRVSSFLTVVAAMSTVSSVGEKLPEHDAAVVAAVHGCPLLRGAVILRIE